MLKSDCFVLTWDIGHSKATKEMDTPFICARKDKLYHFHIHDGCENPSKDHLALGDEEPFLYFIFPIFQEFSTVFLLFLYLVLK